MADQYDALAFALNRIDKPANRPTYVNADLAEALNKALGLIRKAQERLTVYLLPDSCHDETECMNELLEMFDGPEQREIEDFTRAALRSAGVLPQDDGQRAPNGRRV